MKLNAKLRKLCAARNWAQTDLLEAIGGSVSRTTMNNYFSGRYVPDVDVGLKIARVLGVPLDYLADDDQDEPPAPAELPDDEKTALEIYRAVRERVGRGEALLRLATVPQILKHEEAARTGILPEGVQELKPVSSSDPLKHRRKHG